MVPRLFLTFEFPQTFPGSLLSLRSMIECLAMDSFQPIACRLDALSPWERTRRASLAGRLLLLVGRIDELPNGFQLEIASQHRSDMLELVALEQRCCSFLSFEHSNDGDGLRLKITGREGVKTFLAAEFGLEGRL